MKFNRQVMNLDEFTIQDLKNYPGATGQLSGLLRDIGLAAKRVNVEVNKAGIADILGEAGKTNVQGESVKKLDEFANDQIINSLASSIYCAGVASEENETFIAFTDEYSMNSKYVVLMDPLDGSSNIDVNVSIGTIFSVYRRVSPNGTPVTLEDFLQPGSQQIAAGYIIYGSSTMLVYATRRTLQGFTLDPSIGEFCLSHPDLKVPEDSDIFSVNMGYYHLYDEKVRNAVDLFMAKGPGRRCTATASWAVWWRRSTVPSSRAVSLCTRRSENTRMAACAYVTNAIPCLSSWKRRGHVHLGRQPAPAGPEAHGTA